jgi:hypothetical protein
MMLVACQTPTHTSTPPVEIVPTASEEREATFTITPSKTPSPSPVPPPLVILWSGENADQAITSDAEEILQTFVLDHGLRLEIREKLTIDELVDDVVVVVAVPPAVGLAEFLSSRPEISFIALDVPDLERADNLFVIGSDSTHPDYQGFLAGYIAAIITEDWRVGVISISDTFAGQAARQAFIYGGKYFCGLCLQNYPPYHNYPVYVEIPSSSSKEEWYAAGDFLLTMDVETIYVVPGAGDETLLEYLAQQGINLIGGISPTEKLSPNWVATISPDLSYGLREMLPYVLEGNVPEDLSLPILIINENPALLSPGRKSNALVVLADLEEGLIYTGVD